MNFMTDEVKEAYEWLQEATHWSIHQNGLIDPVILDDVESAVELLRKLGEQQVDLWLNSTGE